MISQEVKRKVTNVLLAVFVGVLIAFWGVSNFEALTGKGEYYEGKIIYAAPMMDVEHTYMYIPAGREHYYAGLADDGLSVVVIRAGKNWLEENFDEKGLALSEGGIEIKGKYKRIHIEAREEIREYFEGTNDFRFPMDSDYCADILYYHYAVLSLIAGALVFLSAGVFYLITEKNLFLQSRYAPHAAIIGLLASLVFFLYTLTMK